MRRQGTAPPEQVSMVPAAPAEAQRPPERNEERERHRSVTIHPRPFQTDRQWRDATERSMAFSWSAKIYSKVTHPKYGSVVVPHRSSFSAITCAAEVWGCDWSEVLDATVTWPDPGDKITNRPERKTVFRR